MMKQIVGIHASASANSNDHCKLEVKECSNRRLRHHSATTNRPYTLETSHKNNSNASSTVVSQIQPQVNRTAKFMGIFLSGSSEVTICLVSPHPPYQEQCKHLFQLKVLGYRPLLGLQLLALLRDKRIGSAR